MPRFLIFLFTSTLFILRSFSVVGPVSAQSCPGPLHSCFDSQGQPATCDSPCIRVVVRQGGPRGGQPSCECQRPNSPGTVPLGGRCQEDTDCAPPGRYCWGAFSANPTCHAMSFQEFLQGADPFCNAGSGPDTGVKTALGCVSFYTQAFTSSLLTWSVGLAGGIGFILLLLAAFLVITASGDPKRLQAGKELLFSVLTGLLLIALSVVILNFIGLDILGLGSLGFSV